MDERRHGSVSPNLIRGGAFLILLVLGIFAGRLVVQGRPKVAPPEPKVTEQTLSGSFSDIFSGTAWIDEQSTTLYHDRTSGAFLFPPNFVWTRADDGIVLMEMEKGVPWEQICVGEKCLIIRAQSLFLKSDGKETVVSYPGANGPNIVQVAAAPLSSEWLVGVMRREGENYLTKIFRYNGTDFRNVFLDGRDAFVSSKKSFLGLGGSDNEWMALWSGYEGHALRSRFGGEPEDISSYFGIRLMNDGFLPHIVRVAGRESVNWYMWGVSEGNPRMIKLLEMLDGEIGGAVNFTPLLFDELTTKIIPRFLPTSEGVPTFLIRIDKREGGAEWKKFQDYGFRSDVSRSVVSKNIKTGGGVTRSTLVSPLRLFSGGSEVKFDVSTDGNKWISVPQSTEVVFDGSDTGLYWRATFEEGNNTRITPFFEGIHVDYKELP